MISLRPHLLMLDRLLFDILSEEVMMECINKIFVKDFLTFPILSLLSYDTNEQGKKLFYPRGDCIGR